MTEGNHEKNPNHFGQQRDLNFKLSEYESSAMNFDRRYALCIQKLYLRPHLTVGGNWNKSLHLQPLQRCYCENSESLASECPMRRRYSITYTQSILAIPVGRVRNLLCGRPRMIKGDWSSMFPHMPNIMLSLLCLFNSSGSVESVFLL